MSKCPECGSTRISKEKWHDAVPNAFEMVGSAALGQTGDLVCNDCKHTSTPHCFETKNNDEGKSTSNRIAQICSTLF